MLGVLSLLLGVLKMFFSARAATGEKGISLRKARALARKMARMLEHVKAKGSDRREEIVRALIAQGVAEPLARIVAEEAAAEFSLRG